MSETVLNNFNEYLINRKEFSTNTINSYDRDLKKIFLYLAEKAAEEAVKKDSTIVSKALKKLFEEYNVKSSNSDVEAYIKSMLEGNTSAQ